MFVTGSLWSKAHVLLCKLFCRTLSAGDSTEEVLEAFPQLCREDVLACLGYAARVGEIHSRVELVS